MKNVCIVFSGGTYGTFIEWCLNYFSDESFNETLPFTKTGSSHNFPKYMYNNFAGIVKYVNSDLNYPTVRCHPKTLEDENILDNLEFINQNFKKVIYLSMTSKSVAWSINNKFDKTYSEGWIQHCESMFVKHFKSWGEYSSYKDMEVWELREFLSFYIYDQHLSENELLLFPYIIDKFKNFRTINIDELRDNFKETILSLLSYCELPIVRIDKIEDVYNKWISHQIHCRKDQLITNIVNAIINNESYDWSDTSLSIVDEALVQYYLRKNNINIKCYKLNIFPTDTNSLRKYIE